MLAVASVVASIALFIAGTGGGSGTHGERGIGYFVGALVAMLLAGVFTYVGLTSNR